MFKCTRVICLLIALLIVIGLCNYAIFAQSVDINLQINRYPINVGDTKGKVDISIPVYGDSQDLIGKAVIKAVIYDNAGLEYTDFSDIKRTGPFTSTNSDLPYYIMENMSIELPFNSNYRIEVSADINGEKYSIAPEEFDLRPTLNIYTDNEIVLKDNVKPVWVNGIFAMSWEPVKGADYYVLYFGSRDNISYENIKNQYYVVGGRTSVGTAIKFLRYAKEWFVYVVAFKGNYRRIGCSAMYSLDIPDNYLLKQTATPTRGGPPITPTAKKATNTPTPTQMAITYTPEPTPTSTMIQPSNTTLVNVSPSNVTVPTQTPVNTPLPTPDNKPSFQFEDVNLKAAIEKAVGKTIDNITQSDLNNITQFNAKGLGIVSLEGLQNLKNLRVLNLESNIQSEPLLLNNIVDLKPIEGITALTELKLANNKISDISILKNLTNMITLDLGGNLIEDVSSLSNLINLESLSLYNNHVVGIEPLSKLKKLKYLDLGYNYVEDITPLGGLTNLNTLYLDFNNISVVTSLSGLTNLTDLRIDGNSIVDYTPLLALKNVIKDLSYLGPPSTDMPLSTPLDRVNGTPNGNVTLKPSTTPAPTVKVSATPTPKAKPEATEPVKKIPAIAVFEDMIGHWAEKDMQMLLDNGILTGYPDGTVRPDGKITRAEIVVMLVKAANLTPDGSLDVEFTDNDSIPTWATGYLKTAFKEGIIKGFKDNSIKPSNRLTRKEMAVMALRTYEYPESSNKTSEFKDSGKIPKWAKGFITKAVEMGIIKGYKDNTFRPDNNITRAEACTIIAKCMENAEK